MKLFVVQGDIDFHWLHPVGEEPWPCQSGVPVDGGWRIPKLSLGPDDAQAFLPVDCLAMNTGGDGPLISRYARDKLGSLLEVAGEFWPVDVLGHEYWWFNCLASADALDRAATDAEWGEVEGEWGRLRWIISPRRLAFRPDEVEQAAPVFRVPEFPQGPLFAGAAVQQAVLGGGLTGFRLDLVWSLGEGGVRDPAGFGFNDLFGEGMAADAAEKRRAAEAVLQGRAAGAD